MTTLGTIWPNWTESSPWDRITKLTRLILAGRDLWDQVQYSMTLKPDGTFLWALRELEPHCKAHLNYLGKLVAIRRGPHDRKNLNATSSKEDQGHYKAGWSHWSFPPLLCGILPIQTMCRVIPHCWYPCTSAAMGCYSCGSCRTSLHPISLRPQQPHSPHWLLRAASTSTKNPQIVSKISSSISSAGVDKVLGKNYSWRILVEGQVQAAWPSPPGEHRQFISTWMFCHTPGIRTRPPAL